MSHLFLRDILLEDFLIFEKFFFNRPTKDMSPWQTVEKDGKLYLVVNMLGIDEKDISISVENSMNYKGQYLVIHGKTMNETLDKEYSFSSRHRVRTPIKSIDWSAKDGLVTLEIEFEQPVKPSVRITRK